jgi:hypothetical protein
MSFCAARGGQGLTMLTAHEIVVEANGSEIPVGIDGETVMMPTPVRWPSGRRRCGSGYPEIAGTCLPQARHRLADAAAAGLLPGATARHGLTHL